MPQQRRPYQRRDTRFIPLVPPPLTQRDYQILWAIYQYRALTTHQLQDLFFPSLHKAYRRLQKLYQCGLVDRRFRGAGAVMMNTPIVYVLDRRGAEALLKQGYTLNWHRRHKQLTAFFLPHILNLSTIRVAMTKACEQQQYSLLEWRSDNDLKASYDHVNIRGQAQPVPVIPDSYCCLATPQGHVHLFWEMDRGTMPHKRFQQKIAAYLAYARTQLPRERFNTATFRVLTVTESVTRTANLKRATEQAGGQNRFWFSTLSDLTSETILTTPIWQKAGQTEQVALLRPAHEKRAALGSKIP